MLRYFTLLDTWLYSALCSALLVYKTLYKFLQRMYTFCTKWHTRSLRRGKLPPKTPKWPKSALEVTSMLPKWAKVTSESPQSGSRCSQNEPKCSQVVPQGLPRPPKIDQKRSPRPSRDTFKKMNVLCFWSGLVREPNYLLCFEHIENPYVSGN